MSIAAARLFVASISEPSMWAMTMLGFNELGFNELGFNELGFAGCRQANTQVFGHPIIDPK